MKRLALTTLAALALATLSLGRAHAQASYTVTDLGTLGGPTSTPYGINNSGQVCGDTTNAKGYNLAFLWIPTSPNAPTGSMQDLGGLANYSHFARSINASGQVAGTQENGTFSYATLWTAPGKASKLGGNESRAFSVNGYGEVVGYTRTSNTGPLAYILWKGGKQYTLGPDNYWTGMAINDYGQVVYNNGLWIPGVPRGASGTTYPIGFTGAAINASGQVTGERYLWSPSTPNGSIGAMTADLGTLGGASTWADGINAAGMVVGESQTGTGEYHAFFWNSMDGMLDLNNLIPAGSDWLLTQANGINDAGQIIGVGLHGGVQRAFLLTPNP